MSTYAIRILAEMGEGEEDESRDLRDIIVHIAARNPLFPTIKVIQVERVPDATDG